MKKYILLFFAIYFSLTGSLLAQNITLLGSTTASAKGSGTGGKPTNFNWDIPAGENRVMIVHFWFERDHRPAPFQDNYPSGNFGADFFPMVVGSQNMTGRTVLRSFAISGSGTASASNSEFGTLFYRYTLSDSQGLPTGVTAFDFSGIETPLNTADEVAVSIEVYGNVSPATTYAGASTSSYGYTSTSNQTTTFSVTPTATTAPSGRVANDIVYVGFGATSKDENISISSTGWTSINNVRVNNNLGNTFTGSDLSISNEADGISLLTSYRNGIAGTTLTKSSNQGMAYVRLNIVPLLPLAKPSVSGTVYRDTDGPTNINGTGTNAGGSYINVVDPATNLVVATVAVAAGGTFTIPAGVLVEGTTYHFQLSKNQGTVNSAPPAMGLSGYSYVGEDLDATGNDGTADGILDVTIGTTATVGLRFGVNTCAAGVTAPAVQNITNTCPATTVNLNTAHTGTVPAGSSLVWFTNNAHTGTALSGTQVTQAGSGTYYAFYYDTIGNCYSNASNPVEANIIGCYTCPPDPYAAQQTWWLPSSTKIRIDFQTGSPVLNNPATGFLGQGISGGFEGNATVTHPVTGELLFVTDGNRLYRGSDGALASGPFVGGNGSAGEAAGVIPDPQGVLGRDFIIFGNATSNLAGTLNSAKYNLETNTISNVVTLLPASSIYEALEVIPHTNGTDYWVLVNTADQKVKSYLYSKVSGFNSVAVSTTDVANLAGVDPTYIATNSFISWDPRNPGKVLIARHNKVGLANFNPSTGNLGSWQVYVTTASTSDLTGYSAALSPNGRYLYYDDYNSGANTHSLKYFDITTGTTTTILNNAPVYASGFKIAPDGKLYIVQWNTATNSYGLFYLNANANTPPATTGSVLLFNTGGRVPSLQLPNNVYWACATCEAGTNAPALASTTITSNPSTIGDLVALLSASNQPSGTVITIHSGTPATDANKLANSTAIVAGTTYYAAFYDGLAICYSPTTDVLIQSTCPPDPYTAQQTWWLTYNTSKVRIDFQTGSAVLNNPATGFLGQGTTGGFEGSTAVTHPITGELLFVTDGNRLYKGSTGALATGGFVGGHASSEEAAAVIPDPQGVLGRDFIIFGNATTNTAGTLNSAKYNLETNTISNVTTLLPASSIYEALEVIPHTNGTDYWILLNTTDQKVKSYLYSSTSGFNATAVSTTDVSNLAGLDPNFIAPDSFISWDPRNAGKVLIARHNKVGLANFNPTTGVLGTWDVKVTVTSGGVEDNADTGYSAALSPNGRYIYYVEYVSASNTQVLKYYDLTTGTTTTLDSTVGPPTGIKIAPDGKLYRTGFAGFLNQLYYINANANTPPTTSGSQVLFSTGGREVGLQLPNNTYWACATCQSGTAAPALASTTITSNPATVGDLIALLSASNQPAGTIITIHSATLATDANKLANSTAIVAGTTYYASFYDGLAICYSPTTAVTVSSSVCYKPGILDAGNTYPTKHGITALGRAGAENDNWPMTRQSAWTVLESKEKGFVVNRVATTAGLTNITNPVEGMMVYDEEADCLKIFTLKEGDAAMAWHCFVTPACPD